MRPSGILETVLYAPDLAVVEEFYERVLGLKPQSRVEGRHVFFALESQMLLIFNPEATCIPPKPGMLPVPVHGMRGEGHVCFRATAAEMPLWRARLDDLGIEIEADFVWPRGGRSIYFRDPAGNCLEIAEPKLWGFSE
jgi:catechol 2,3-dioxygenase-like lactoylglutathione lyase family enzyme